VHIWHLKLMVIWCFECSIQVCLVDPIHLYTILFRHVDISYCMVFLWLYSVHLLGCECNSSLCFPILWYLVCENYQETVIPHWFHTGCWREYYIKGKANQPFLSVLASVHIVWATSRHLIFNLSSISVFRLWPLLLQIWHAEEKMLCITGQRMSIHLKLNKKVRKSKSLETTSMWTDIYWVYVCKFVL